MVPATEPVRPLAPRAKKSAEAEASESAARAKPDPRELEAAVERFSAQAASLEFSINKDDGRTIVRVVDRETQTLIRQIPSEEALAISKALDQMQGLLLKMKA